MLHNCLIIKFPAAVLTLCQPAHLLILIGLWLAIWLVNCGLLIRILAHHLLRWRSSLRLLALLGFCRNLIRLFNWTILNRWRFMLAEGILYMRLFAVVRSLVNIEIHWVGLLIVILTGWLLSFWNFSTLGLIFLLLAHRHLSTLLHATLKNYVICSFYRIDRVLVRLIRFENFTIIFVLSWFVVKLLPLRLRNMLKLLLRILGAIASWLRLLECAVSLGI